MTIFLFLNKNTVVAYVCFVALRPKSTAMVMVGRLFWPIYMQIDLCLT